MSIAMSEMSEIVIFETSMGVIEIEMDRENAPITVENFVKYASNGFFDGTVFHRVIPGFVVQGGGHLPDCTQKQTRAPIKLEADNGLRNYRGTISMARTNDPNSATSQFFLNLVDNGNLNRSPGNDGYAVFGKITTGMDVVDRIASVRTGGRGMNRDWPIEDITIKRAYVKN
ncbi:peptidyl-prolyl cis-trans isomerase [Candidatus Bathyarchaeota archaeon]|nr:peptidyl-prolyl cis-trans isomerase [Candidatus Bathyarchaeota archaeon]